MSNFEDAPESIVELTKELINDSFPSLINANIKILFINKKKTTKGQLILGSMNKATPRENYLTSSMNDSDDGINYIMILDGNVIPNLDLEDQKRVIRHELNHCFIDLDAKDPYKIVGHEIEDFYNEVEYNKNDPRWKERVFAVAESIYSAEEE